MEYSIVIYWLRAKLSFNLLRSAVLCVRGSKTIKQLNISGAEIRNEIGKARSRHVLFIIILHRVF